MPRKTCDKRQRISFLLRSLHESRNAVAGHTRVLSNLIGGLAQFLLSPFSFPITWVTRSCSINWKHTYNMTRIDSDKLIQTRAELHNKADHQPDANNVLLSCAVSGSRHGIASLPTIVDGGRITSAEPRSCMFCNITCRLMHPHFPLTLGPWMKTRYRAHQHKRDFGGLTPVSWVPSCTG